MCNDKKGNLIHAHIKHIDYHAVIIVEKREKEMLVYHLCGGVEIALEEKLLSIQNDHFDSELVHDPYYRYQSLLHRQLGLEPEMESTVDWQFPISSGQLVHPLNEFSIDQLFEEVLFALQKANGFLDSFVVTYDFMTHLVFAAGVQVHFAVLALQLNCTGVGLGGIGRCCFFELLIEFEVEKGNEDSL